MTTISIIISMKMSKSINPTNLALMILTMSLMTSIILFKASMSSWLAFILILTFSSGMMTLFIYITSLTPNEKSKNQKTKLILIVPLIMSMSLPIPLNKTNKESMKTFSSQSMILPMTLILILTMVTILAQGYNPQQTMSTSF